MRFPFASAEQGRAAPSALRESGELFNKIRLMAGMTLTDTAHRLHTTPSVIQALETGDARRLPPWSETMVIVSGFTALAGVDPRPVLGALAPAFGETLPEVSQPASRGRSAGMTRTAPAALSQAKPKAKPAASRRKESLAQAMRRKLPIAKLKIPKHALARLQQKSTRIGAAVALSFVLLTSYGSVSVLQAGVSSLPQPFSGAFRKVEDYWLYSSAPRDEHGFLWIEVRDPRSRKTGKLPAPRS